MCFQLFEISVLLCAFAIQLLSKSVVIFVLDLLVLLEHVFCDLILPHSDIL